jgi:hypothetical protein
MYAPYAALLMTNNRFVFGWKPVPSSQPKDLVRQPAGFL